MTYEELEHARNLLGLGNRATIREIRTRHRHLVKQHHPDSGSAPDQEFIREINRAYQIITAYLAEYRISFTEQEFYEQCPDEFIRRQFRDDPVWGNG